MPEGRELTTFIETLTDLQHGQIETKDAEQLCVTLLKRSYNRCTVVTRARVVNDTSTVGSAAYSSLGGWESTSGSPHVKFREGQ